MELDKPWSMNWSSYGACILGQSPAAYPNRAKAAAPLKVPTETSHLYSHHSFLLVFCCHIGKTMHTSAMLASALNNPYQSGSTKKKLKDLLACSLKHFKTVSNFANANEKEALLPKSYTEVRAGFFPGFSSIWTVQLGKKQVFSLMDLCKCKGGGLWWCISVDCVSSPCVWLNFGPFSFGLYLYSCSCYSPPLVPFPSCPVPPPSEVTWLAHFRKSFQNVQIGLWSILMSSTQAEKEELVNVQRIESCRDYTSLYLCSSWCHYCFNPRCPAVTPRWFLDFVPIVWIMKGFISCSNAFI